ncbi:hypothetical protein CHLV4142_09520 [Campylobacter helveticus]|uniref:Secreted protein n=1 Tax=Campylobacter helveticus TaxID=28898 RepID=A0ABY3L3L2_9BACT|nr:hypothetical protein [Campylobacter helveticus]MCR2040378.1 hypothetical protein [Campylobacter helveticus]MCR2061005.1 hypothetical protein [Campylobacter helveticus]TNB59255.1 hypothetical protein FDR72_08730 [Campylobacter helveticus]TXK58179.1 hypothetical protein FVD16_03800 [Campylobacter helveticus]
MILYALQFAFSSAFCLHTKLNFVFNQASAAHAINAICEFTLRDFTLRATHEREIILQIRPASLCSPLRHTKGSLKTLKIRSETLARLAKGQVC